MIAPKFCVHCKMYAAASNSYKGNYCGHEFARNVVTGEPEISCADMRGRHALCGPEGKLFVRVERTPADIVARAAALEIVTQKR